MRRSRKRGEEVDKETMVEFRTALLEFVKRATQKGATQAEVEALPQVAQVLVDLIKH